MHEPVVCEHEGLPPTRGRRVKQTVLVIEPVPERVKCAFNFVSLCNKNMGWRMFENNNGEFDERDLREQKLHPAQEDTFLAATQMLTRYFEGRPLDRPKEKPAYVPAGTAFVGF